MEAKSAPKLQFGKQRANPFATNTISRFQAVRTVAKAGFIISSLSTLSASGCGLVAGGMHGLLVAGGLFAGMGVLGMMVAMSIAVFWDATSAVKDGLSGRTLESRIVEKGGGQLSVSKLRQGSQGAVSLRDERARRRG